VKTRNGAARSRGGSLTTALILWLWACPLVGWAQSSLFEMPSGAVAFYAMDPSAFGVQESPTPQRQLVEGAIRAALSSGLIAEKDATDILGGLLAASVVGSAPHKLCVLDFEARSLPGDERWEMTRLAAVLEVRTNRDHRSLVRTLQSILVGDGGQQDGTQSPIQLPGGVRGMSFTRAGWPAWRQITWASTDDAFYVAIGADALQTYLTPYPGEPGESDERQWAFHRSEVERFHEARGDAAAELFLDVNKIRRGFSDSFAEGRLGDLFGAWGLENARSFMIHARRVPTEQVRLLGERNHRYDGPPTIAIDATWSSRADLPTTVGHRPVARADWPARDLRLAPPPGSYVIVAEMDWRYVEELISTSFRQSRKPSDRIEIDAERKAWDRKYARTLSRVLRSLEKWVVVSDVPKPIAPVPGLTTAFIELKPAVNRPRFERDLAALFSSMGDRVIYDDESASWSFRLLDAAADPSGVFRALAWGLAGPPRHGVVVVGWGLRAIETNRERLKEN
jgi:hypothetical protein